ncbi:MAG: Adenylosuccinate lyase [Candidatus Thorarchaeota archaeon]|nr:MAG: Adenylosuccinate lyase [Candidatus Thorarchaeota archaeon]
MPVCPIDYGRYGHPDMIKIFEEEHRHKLWLKIEATVAEVQSEIGLIPADAAGDIVIAAIPETVTLERTMEIEARTRHDIAALFEAIAEQCQGPGARWVHFGLTSNDVKDTALALQFKDAFDVLMPKVEELCMAVVNRAVETKDLVAVGRSHGQHAVPITYGLRFAVWLDEIRRHRRRLLAARERVIVGKLAGATGSHAALGPKGLLMQEKVLKKLGLHFPIVTTQITQRDRHAEVVCTLANLASSLDKIATDLRNLQRTEIAETYEPFAKGKQVGSSAMPHKRNPVTCEKISGIARFVRSLVQPALENVVSWEERDISHSSTERFVFPQAFILVDYLVREMKRVIEGLEIDEEAIKRNLELSNNQILSEYVITELTKAGMERPKAHEKLRDMLSEGGKKGKGLLEMVKKDKELSKLLKDSDLDLEKYFSTIRTVSWGLVRKTIAAYHDDLTSSTK